MNPTTAWYAELTKPFFAPPSWVFGPVWTVLYLVIAITFGFVFWKVLRRQWPLAVATPFALNLVFNFAFSPIQFGLQNNALASLDIVLVLLTLVFALRRVYPLASWIVIANIPYLLWVGFATLLQFSITLLNWK